MLVRRNSTIDYRDPFALARDLLGWEPFTGERAVPGFTARFDVKEREDAYVVTADLPGFKEGDVDISLDNGVLTVAGARVFGENKQEGETWYLYERQHGSFSRAFRLPAEIAQDKIEAGLKEGILTLVLPKRPEAQPRKIKVRS